MSKIFISYKSEDASVADEIKSMLESFGFETFQDKVHIEPSDEWQQTILRESMFCDIFLCVLSKDFLSSPFCLQETGIAAARGIPVLPISIDSSVPPGFISKFQAAIVKDKTITESLLLNMLVKYKKDKVINYLINFYLAKSTSFRIAEDRMKLVMSMKEHFSPKDYENILAVSKDNGQIWDASKCVTDYLPKLHQYTLEHIPSYHGSETYRFFDEKLKRAD